jgi:hypothetical protein
MQAPFPELAGLYLSIIEFSIMPAPVLPDSFLDGSAPRLRRLYLRGIPFPGLPNLLMSATHLVDLWLLNIPYPRLDLPEAMAACLPTLNSLESLHLEFKSSEDSEPQPNCKSRRLSPPTRSVLPTLKNFQFKGVVKYLEIFVARINAPHWQLYRLSTAFFNDIDFDTPELKQFISRTPTFGTCNEACFIFDTRKGLLRLRQSHPSHLTVECSK